MKQPFILFLLLIILSACSSRVISFYVVEENKIQFKTFSFYARSKQNLNPQKVRLDSLIEELISYQLIMNNYKKEYPSDVYIAYKFISDKTFNTHTDYSPPLNQANYTFDNPNLPNNSNFYYVTEQKEGVFMIEIFDNNDKLIWQGSKSFKLNKSTDTKELFQKYVEQIVATFKPRL